jgi:thiamine biosynthesis protein ThiS
VADLLVELKVSPQHVAVEINRQLVPRRLHGETRLAEGDEMEVVTLVGGG